VPTSRGIIACCNEFGRRRNDQRMFVLICKIPMTLLSKARAPFGDAGSGSIERGGERRRERAICSRASFWQRLALKLHMAEFQIRGGA
jgi:hypothetical protein